MRAERRSQLNTAFVPCNTDDLIRVVRGESAPSNTRSGVEVRKKQKYKTTSSPLHIVLSSVYQKGRDTGKSNRNKIEVREKQKYKATLSPPHIVLSSVHQEGRDIRKRTRSGIETREKQKHLCTANFKNCAPFRAQIQRKPHAPPHHLKKNHPFFAERNHHCLCIMLNRFPF